MAIHMYLKLDDIKGEATKDKHSNEIEVLSWSWGLTQQGSSQYGTGSSTAGVTVTDLSIVKYLDSATPALIKQCCSGKAFTSAKLTVLKASDGAAIEYLTLELQDGIISGVHSGGVGPDERLIETLTLNFKIFKLQYQPQDDKGKKGGAIPAGWDIPKGKPVA